MSFKSITITEALVQKHFNKVLQRTDFDVFKTALKTFLNSINKNESEEHNKNHISDFLKNAFYKNDFAINTKARLDLVIHNEKDSNSSVGVIIECKSIANKNEWLKN